MRGVPLLHCGTWLAHALALPRVHRVYHLGGDLDFDNAYRWLAPWSAIRGGKLTVWPAVRQFDRGRWRHVEHEPLKRPGNRLSADRLAELLQPRRAELASRPLYVSLDKDVLRSEDAIVNWESGFLDIGEVTMILSEFIAAAQGRMAGMDVTGDWSPVQTQGLLRRWLDFNEHPKLSVDPQIAADRNGRTNAAIVQLIESLAGECP
jgi:hypothetical protein